MRKSLTPRRDVRLRSLWCTVLFSILLVAAGPLGLDRLWSSHPHNPITEAERLGLPPLASMWPDRWHSELRIWAWTSDDGGENRDGVLLRLQMVGDRVDGDLLAMADDPGGFHPRRSLLQRDWAAVLRALEGRSVWNLHEVTASTACFSGSMLIVESYRLGRYRRVDVPSTADYGNDQQSIDNVSGIFGDMFDLARDDARIAVLESPPSLDC